MELTDSSKSDLQLMVEDNLSDFPSQIYPIDLAELAAKEFGGNERAYRKKLPAILESLGYKKGKRAMRSNGFDRVVIWNLSTPLVNEDIRMTTVEIAELTKKRHDHIIRDSEKMFTELEIGAPKFGGTYKTLQGKEVKCYFLTKRLTEILITGYSIKLRAAVIDRMHELEAKIVAPQELTILDYAKALIAQSDAHKIEKKFIQDKREATTMNRLAQLSTDEEIKKQIKESIENCKGFINPKVIADLGDFKSAQFVNKILCVLNLQVSITAVSVKTKVKGEWVTYKSRFKLTEEGKFYGSEYLNPINLRGIQISLRWSKAVIDLIDEYLEQ